MRKQSLTKVFLVIALFGFVFWLSASGDTRIEKPDPLLPKVRTAAVAESNLSTEIRFSGVLRARQRAAVSFAVAGRMLKRPVTTGDRVEKGQVVAELDRQPFINARDAAKARVAELNARMEQAERDLQRARDLLASRAATKEELEKIQAETDALRAALNSANTAAREADRLLNETVLRAPFTGHVTDAVLEPGEFAGAGMPIVNISGSKQLEMEIEVQESILPQLQPGKTVHLELPFSQNRRVAAAIRTLGPSAGGPGRLFPVIVAVDEQESGLVSGMTAELILHLEQESAMAIPVGAVVNPGGNNPGVWRVREGRVEKVAVEVGRLVNERVTIRGPLNAGDLVVTGGFSGLVQNESVEVMQ